ncbi:TPA: metallophosphoesterase family protein, partial [Clostridioides difficile]|nr:metallophosphoesterase family protein [Clostridioides difficile]
LDPGAEGGPYTLFLTHGHVYGPGYHNSVDSWPALPPHSALVYGHTHIKVSEKDAEHGAWVFNPGSAGIPKDGSASYGVYESGRFEHRML